MTEENDIVLIYFEDNPFSFARIEEILPDIKRDWYQVKLLFLQMPVQVGTWILRSEYINGEEFTMGGKRMRMEKVVCPEEPEEPDLSEKESEKPETQGSAKIISMANRKKTG